MKSILVVIDAQNEFIADPRLEPTVDTFVPRLGAALERFRKKNQPVVHIHYITEEDGRGYLPHHKAQNRPRCLRGTVEAEPHPIATPADDEPVFAKQAYSAFSSQAFMDYLKLHSIDTLVLCGLHTHVCIRQTAIDALADGYSIFLVKDAIASYDPLHAQITETFLREHGVRFCNSQTVFDDLQSPQTSPAKTISEKAVFPVAQIDGEWIPHTREQTVELRNPSAWNEINGYVPLAEMAQIDAAVSSANQSQNAWKKTSLEERWKYIEQWAAILEEKQGEFLPLMVKEIGKPISACRFEWELLRSSLEVLKSIVTENALTHTCVVTDQQEAIARRCPHGVVAIIAPWNNPVFLPASKIAAAILLGNSVVWKPALPCIQTSITLQDSLNEAEIPSGVVNLVFGGADTAGRLIKLPGIHAVTLTGSVETGRNVAAICGSLLKPLQAELGGNNAAIVTRHCNLKDVAEQIITSAFVFAGKLALQRGALLWSPPSRMHLLQRYKSQYRLSPWAIPMTNRRSSDR